MWEQKRLYLGLIFLLLGMGNALQAYKLTIKNNTQYKVTFSVYYLKSPEAAKSFCRADKNKIIEPGKSYKTESWACIVGRINAKVYKNPEKPVKAEPYTAPGGGIKLTWIIKSTGKNKFKVVRKQ